ncbi:hypothetical protein [Kordiimonas aestuarii]|uniref:hypothetical protein n=1 Tax=Kordiimonas aestuarii TaxID=1005925 RepID=UPI0021D2BB87|nr:hypothetical protein [Kordiimonas aestuarii]
MSQAPHPSTTTIADAPTTAEAETMAEYGIVHSTVNYYQLGDFRYTSLKDAVAQAKRTN